MSDPKPFEIEIRVRGAAPGDDAVRHLEGKLDHETANDVAVDIVAHMDSRSRGKLKHVAGTDR